MTCKFDRLDYTYSLEKGNELSSFNTNIYHEDGDLLLQIEGVFTHCFEKEIIGGDFYAVSRKILDCDIRHLHSLFDGVYRVVVLDKTRKRCRVFTSIDGQLPLFISHLNTKFIIGTSVKEISDIYYDEGRSLTLSTDGAYMLLGHGFMLENYTLFSEIQRVPPHKCLDLDHSHLVSESHSIFNYNELEEDENILIEEFNRLFVAAIEKQFTFDTLGSRKSLVALSGGLDSRMVSWVAHQQGYTSQVNYTFAQVGSGDELIPKQIASFLGHDWLFNFLDNGNYLLDFQDSITLTEGNSVFTGIAHSLKFYKYLDFSKFGVVHSGQLGDVILAWPSTKYTRPDLDQGAYNKSFVRKISPSLIDLSVYQNDMDFKYLNRYINGTNYGLHSVNSWTCTFSPFLDLDVWQFLTQVPLKYKVSHKFYVKWMSTYYPEASNFVYDSWNIKPNAIHPLFEGKINFRGRAENIIEMGGKIYRAASRKLGILHKPSMKAMNPYEAWWLLNPELPRRFTQLFDDHIEVLDKHTELQNDVATLFLQGKVSEKLQAMDLLLALNYINNFK